MLTSLPVAGGEDGGTVPALLCRDIVPQIFVIVKHKIEKISVMSGEQEKSGQKRRKAVPFVQNARADTKISRVTCKKFGLNRQMAIALW